MLNWDTTFFSWLVIADGNQMASGNASGVQEDPLLGLLRNNLPPIIAQGYQIMRVYFSSSGVDYAIIASNQASWYSGVYPAEGTIYEVLNGGRSFFSFGLFSNGTSVTTASDNNRIYSGQIPADAQSALEQYENIGNAPPYTNVVMAASCDTPVWAMFASAYNGGVGNSSEPPPANATTRPGIVIASANVDAQLHTLVQNIATLDTELALGEAFGGTGSLQPSEIPRAIAFSPAGDWVVVFEDNSFTVSNNFNGLEPGLGKALAAFQAAKIPIRHVAFNKVQLGQGGPTGDQTGTVGGPSYWGTGASASWGQGSAPGAK